MMQRARKREGLRVCRAAGSAYCTAEDFEANQVGMANPRNVSATITKIGEGDGMATVRNRITNPTKPATAPTTAPA